MRLAVDKGYKWYRFQKAVIDKLYEKQKVTVLISRQCGKTELGAKLIGDFLFRYAKRKNPRALICMVSQQQAFDFYFKRIDEALRHLPKSVYYKQGGKDQPLVIYFKRPHFGDVAQVTIVGTGNAKALRGGTMDFMILDEMASYGPGLWKSIFEPMLDRTDGKALLTSTPNGHNLFYDLCKDFEKRDKEGDPEVGHIKYDIYEANVHTDEWIKKRKKSYEVINQLSRWYQEYECSFDAATVDEAPFANLVHGLKPNEGLVANDHFALHMVNKVNISVDIGAPGNMATWHWVVDPVTNGVIIRDYKDHYVGLKGLLDELYEQYCKVGMHVHVIFPVDVNSPAMAEGGTYASTLAQHMSTKGYDRVMQLSHLPKVKSKPVLWRQGVQMWQRCSFLWDTCGEGLHKLAGVRFRKVASTEEIKYGEALPNGNQHAADAFLYLCAAVMDEIVPMHGVLPPGLNGVVPAFNGATNYRPSWGRNTYRRL